MRPNVKEEIDRIKQFLKSWDRASVFELWDLLTAFRACDCNHDRSHSELEYKDEKLATVGAIRHELLGKDVCERLGINYAPFNPELANVAMKGIHDNKMYHFYHHMHLAFNVLGWKF